MEQAAPVQLELDIPGEYKTSVAYKEALEDYDRYYRKGWEPHLCYCIPTKKFYATLFSKREAIEKYKQTIIIK